MIRDLVHAAATDTRALAAALTRPLRALGNQLLDSQLDDVLCDELSAKGTPRLSAAFSEWLMGVPAGWITDVPGITRNEALKACGNGVVPQQAEVALRMLAGVGEVAA